MCNLPSLNKNFFTALGWVSQHIVFFSFFFFDKIRFIRYVTIIHEHSLIRQSSEHHIILQYLIYKKFECSVNPYISKNVFSLSSLELFNLELIILAHGLDNCIPAPIIIQEEIYSVFNVLFAQIRKYSTRLTINHFTDLKAMLNEQAIHTHILQFHIPNPRGEVDIFAR